MQLNRFNLADTLGAVALLSAPQLKAGLEIFAIGVGIIAMAPLAYWRWRAFFRERRRERSGK